MGLFAALAGGSAIAGLVGAKLQSDSAKSAKNAEIAFARESADLARQEADNAFKGSRTIINNNANKVADLTRRGFRAQQPIIDETEAAAIEPLQVYADSGKAANAARDYELGIGERPSDYSGFEGSPGFQFAKNEGIRSIDSSAASRGGLQSGATLRSLSGFTTGLAQQDFGNHMNRLSGVASAGQNAATNIAGFRESAGRARMLNTAAKFDGLVDNRNSKTANILDAFRQRSNTKINAGTQALNTAGSASAQAKLASGAAWSGALNNAVNSASRFAGFYNG